MKIGINCGHTLSGRPGSGASKYLNESDETRAVGYPLMDMLREQGHTVVDCTDDNALSTNDNLRNICTLANAQPLDMFVSIHFNAGGGQGVECWTYGGADVCNANEMKHNIAALGFKNRGIKDGSNLYVIKHTKAQAVLIEVCFVDTETDADRYRTVGAKRIAAAICEAITGTSPKTEEENTMEKFKDTAGHYAEKHIEELHQMGVVNGNNGTFAPDEPITRADVSIMVRNAIRYITGK